MNFHSIQFKLLLPILFIGLIVVSICTLFMFRIKEKHIETTGLTTAAAISTQVATTRVFYTTEVLTRTNKAGLKANYDFTKVDNTLPLPATFVKVLGEQITKNSPGTIIRLYSRYPFPHRVGKEQYDTFEQRALNSLEKDPKTPIYELQTYNGRLSMRYATPDLMRQACVDCHNAHPESPKKNWKVGDVRGVLEVIVPVDTVEQTLQSETTLLAKIVIIGFIFIIAFLFILINFKIVQPIKKLSNVSKKISEGTLETPPEVNIGNDEIAHLAQNMNSMIDYLTKMARTANTISLGNLNVQIEPNSREDIFGLVFKKMVLYLREMASIADNIAAGNLTSKVNPLSQKDIFGNSFKKMVTSFRSLVQKLNVSVYSLNKSSEQLVTTANEQVKNTTSQTAYIQQISSILDKMKVIIEKTECDNSQIHLALSETYKANNSILSHVGSEFTIGNNSGSNGSNGSNGNYVKFNGIGLHPASVLQIPVNTNEQTQQSTNIKEIILLISQIKEVVNTSVISARQQQRTARALSQLAKDIDSIIQLYRF